MEHFELLDIVTLLIFLAALFTFINVSCLKLPPTIGLMILALVLSGLILISGRFYPKIYQISKVLVEDFEFSDILLNVMLSFLLFAGAAHINVANLKEEKWPIIFFAFGGTIISTFAIAHLMYLVLQLLSMETPYIYCLLFGALISPTDPIAVLSIVKKLNLSKRLETKIAGESLFNDGVGVVIFMTILHVITQGEGNFGTTDVILLFSQEVLGGVILGAGFGYVGCWLLEIVDNDRVELEVLITLSMVLLGNKFAEEAGFSSPLAMVVMGLFVSNGKGTKDHTNIANEYVLKFWHLIDESLNAILFILIGLEMIIIPYELNYLYAGLFGILVVFISRLSGVLIPIQFMKKVRKFDPNTVSILTWGGLRGGISVALALSLPSFEYKDLIVSMTYCIVLFSILVQGLTIEKWISFARKI